MTSFTKGAEEMREMAAKACEEVASKHLAMADYQAGTAHECTAAIRDLPLPSNDPERMDRLLQEALDHARLLEQERDALKDALRFLYEQVSSLEGYELTRDIEPYKAQANFDDAIFRANEVFRAIKERK